MPSDLHNISIIKHLQCKKWQKYSNITKRFSYDIGDMTFWSGSRKTTLVSTMVLDLATTPLCISWRKIHTLLENGTDICHPKRDISAASKAMSRGQIKGPGAYQVSRQKVAVGGIQWLHGHKE